MSGRRDDTDSPHHGGQAVARAAKIPRSTWPKLSPITPVHSDFVEIDLTAPAMARILLPSKDNLSTPRVIRRKVSHGVIFLACALGTCRKTRRRFCRRSKP